MYLSVTPPALPNPTVPSASSMGRNNDVNREPTVGTSLESSLDIRRARELRPLNLACQPTTGLGDSNFPVA